MGFRVLHIHYILFLWNRAVVALMRVFLDAIGRRPIFV